MEISEVLGLCMGSVYRIEGVDINCAKYSEEKSVFLIKTCSGGKFSRNLDTMTIPGNTPNDDEKIAGLVKEFYRNNKYDYRIISIVFIPDASKRPPIDDYRKIDLSHLVIELMKDGIKLTEKDSYKILKTCESFPLTTIRDIAKKTIELEQINDMNSKSIREYVKRKQYDVKTGMFRKTHKIKQEVFNIEKIQLVDQIEEMVNLIKLKKDNSTTINPIEKIFNDVVKNHLNPSIYI